MANDSILDRVRHAWNAFLSEDKKHENASYYRTPLDYGYSSINRPDRKRLSLGNERSIISSIYNRIAIDVSAIPIKHVRVNDNDAYESLIESGLNECLNIEANIDQTGREFIMDAVMSMFDEGCVALVPVDTNINPMNTSSYDILSMRVGKILEWYPRHVKLEVYNDRIGKKEEISLPKEKIAIVENPLYSVMNEPNSTLKRLITKLNMLDAIDEQTSSSKLDLIIQLPYTIKSESRQEQADKRKKAIEEQLTNSKYGIAYIDSTEHITQLNRPIENNLMNQIEYLTKLLYNQLGLTQEIFDGTASEQVTLNYYNQTIEPILSALVDEMKRKFLTKTARTQGQSIKYFREPFRLVPVGNLANIADSFTRNEILSSNEVRAIIGFKPSTDPNADELRNKNLNQQNQNKGEEVVKESENEVLE